MFIKRIEILGFKSFADRVRIELTPGITSIIGKTGSGKSNIADAIRWVLGESKSKSLGVDSMEDIIFSGSEYRKPLGFADVSLVIDNSYNILPTSFSEVTITRRIFRSGESEYYINRVSCRLKDVTELISETCLGKNGYSVISYSEIDTLLRKKPKDRKAMFDKLFRIIKFKTRISESKKKLELTEQNLERINSIICDLEEWLKQDELHPDEHKKIKERYDFMVTTKDDLLTSKEKLNRIISEMTVHMTDQLNEHLKFINNSFNTYFYKLHGEGRAEIVMTDNENVLDCGIEIYVELPGMKIKNAKHLTGREKTITGIALLMSMISLPSGIFCMFDEIEKEMDTVTLNALLDFLSERTKYKQFVILTQNRNIVQASSTTLEVKQEKGISII